MSHYAVCVFANRPNDFEYLLAKYSETNPNYQEYCALDDDELNYVQAHYGAYVKSVKGSPEKHIKSFREFLIDHHYVLRGEEIGIMRNPNAKWDWCTIDGRDGMFQFKRGHGYDDCGYYKKSDIDFDKADPEDKRFAAEFWDEYVVKNSPEYAERKVYTREYYKQRYKNKRRYIRETARSIPYAFVTPDGEWIAPGNVGWFGSDDSTEESYDEYVKKWDRFVKDAPDCYMTCADCHI